MAGLVVLALFANQSVSSSWTDCHDGRSETTMPAGMDMSDGMADTEPGAPSSPADHHGTDCDHPMPVGNCGVGGSCAVAVPTVAHVAMSPADLVVRPLLDLTGGPLALSIAPDVPPPRA